MSARVKVIETQDEGRIDCPVIECDRCRTIMRGSGNAYFGYVTKTGKMKRQKLMFLCHICSPQQWEKDQAKGISRMCVLDWGSLLTNSTIT
jgi:hypothetical protein